MTGLTSPGQGTGDLVLPGMVLSEVRTNSIKMTIQLDTPPSKPMEHSDIVHSSFVKNVCKKVNNVVYCGSETFKGGNSLEQV